MKTAARLQRGFTLVELMVALAIAGILLLIGVPSFHSTISNNRLAVTVNETIGAFNFARTTAFQRGNNIHVGAAGTSDAGWVVWIEADFDNEWDAGEELRRWDSFPAGVSVVTLNDVVVFDASGLASNNQTITICDDRTGESGSQLTVLRAGSIEKSTIDCS